MYNMHNLCYSLLLRLLTLPPPTYTPPPNISPSSLRVKLFSSTSHRARPQKICVIAPAPPELSTPGNCTCPGSISTRPSIQG